MPGRIDILLPGIFHLPRHELDAVRLAKELPEIHRLLRFASARPAPGPGVDAALRDMLGLDTDPRSGLPLAQAWAENDDAQAARLQLFRPVHLRPDLHQALLVPISESEENLMDISILINDLSDLFKVDCDINVISAGLYLMRLREFDAPTHYPHLLSVLGKPANPYMEQSREHLPWYRLINEMQMFLHQHPVNARRGEAAQLPINSLWCWGGGQRPAGTKRAPAWFCDDPLIDRFAAGLGLHTAPLAELGRAAPDGEIAVVDLRLLEALKTGAVDNLDGLLQAIEHEVVEPALGAAARGGRRLRLRTGDVQDLHLGPRAGLKFWRRPRALAAWSEMDDEI